MTFLRHSLLTTILVTHSLLNFAKAAPSTSSSIEVDPSLVADDVETPLLLPTFTVAQLLPAYKVALKRGMFEVGGGMGHTDGTKETNRGQATYIKKSPQTDYFPVQVAYGIGDNTSISFTGKAIRQQEKVSKTSLEGTSEPQFTISHTFRNLNSAIHISGTYAADIGPRTLSYDAATRTEGNTLAGGASGELTGGYFLRLGPVILGGEASYLYKETRIENSETIALFTRQATGQTQKRIEGGHEKTLRGTVELALPFRFGMTFGRVWVEQEEELLAYQMTPIINNSHYRNFFGGYGRIQVNPKLSILPGLTYSETPDTSDLTSKRDQELSTQVNLRFRF